MNTSLLLLTGLQARAAVRRAVRDARTARGIVFTLVGVLIFVVWLGPVLFSTGFAPRTDPEKVRLFAPLVLLLMVGLNLFAGSAADKAISFSPGEVNFLFPGPFTRRELLFHKLARTCAAAVVSGVFVSLVLRPHASSWLAGGVASVLSILMIQLLTLVVVLAGQTIGERAHSLARRGAIVTVIAAAAIAVAPSVNTASEDGLLAFAAAVRQSTAAQVLLAPFTVLVRAFTAQTYADLAVWAGIGAAVDAGLLALIVRLDADYREASLAASQRVRDRIDRLRRGQVIMVPGNARGKRRRLRLPVFPWLGGAGPTAWRQFTAAVRTSRGMLLIFLILAAGIAPLVFDKKVHGPAVVGMAGWLTIVLGGMLRFDFRADLEQLAWLKALPLRPTATAAGQLAVPVLILTTAQAVVIGTAAFTAPPTARPVLLATLVFLLPFNLLMTATENLLFLLFPSRTAGPAPGDLGHMGRQIVFFTFKILIVATSCGVAAGAGFSAYVLTDSPALGIAAAALILYALAAAAVPCVGRAYDRFDPSLDTPA